MLHIGLDETALLLGCGVALSIAGIRGGRVMVIVRPLGEMVGELKPWQVGGSILKVDDDELLMFIFGLQEGRLLVVWADAENVAVLCLRDL